MLPISIAREAENSVRELIPTVCHMPEVASRCPPLGPRVLLQDAFIGNPGLSDKAVTLRKHFVRLLDQTIREYSYARELVLAQIQELELPTEELIRNGQHIFMFGFVEHLENCLTTCRRALRVLDGLTGEMNVNRTARRHIRAPGEAITNIRNRIEHTGKLGEIGEKIAKGEVKSGDLLVPYLSDDGTSINFGDHAVRCDALASVLETLYSLAADLLTASKR
jgi:hypothetical protein